MFNLYFPSLSKRKLLCALLIVSALLQLTLQAQDKIILKSGEEEIGKIVSLEKKQIHFEKKIGTGYASLTYDLSLIEKITFTLDGNQADLLKSRDPKNIPGVTAIWEQRLPFLSLPESDSWEWGLHLARLKLALNEPTQADEIEKLINFIAEKSWHPLTKEKSSPLLLELALLRGETEKALSMAQELSEIAPDNMNLIADAKWVLALSQLKQVQELEKEFPRWQIMAEKVRERRELLDSALENILFPVVFMPSHKDFVPRALDKAIEIYMILGDHASAINAAQEITQYYPHSAYIDAAKSFLQKNPPPSKDQDPMARNITSATQSTTEDANKEKEPAKEDSPQIKEKTEPEKPERPTFISQKNREKLEEEKKSQQKKQKNNPTTQK